MYAIVEIAGKQFRVSENERLYVPRLRADVGETLTLDRVLLVADEEAVRVGTPVVEGAEVNIRVLDHVKADKVIVFKKKRRKGYRVKKGHRQPYTRIAVESLKTA